MNTINLYGIKTCGSVRKAITLFDKHKIPFHFIDLKAYTPSQEQLIQWIEQKGIKIVLNSKGTTYKTLKKEGKIQDSILSESNDAQDQKMAQIELLSQYPMLLKRPIIDYKNTLIIGYEPEEIQSLIQIFQKQKGK